MRILDDQVLHALRGMDGYPKCCGPVGNALLIILPVGGRVYDPVIGQGIAASGQDLHEKQGDDGIYADPMHGW